MAQFIRVGEHDINLDHIVRNERRNNAVRLVLTELRGFADGSSESVHLVFTGEEAAALAWYFDQEAADVVARMKSRRVDQAEHAAMVEALAETQRRR